MGDIPEMKALQLRNKRDVQIVDVANPICAPGTALLKIHSASICGSDVSAYRGHGQKITYPIILGHEVAGEIIEVEKSEYFNIHDRVLVNPYVYCGHCYPCSIGRTNCCENLKVLGCAATNGAMSEYFVHPISLLHKLPDEIPWELAPLAEPLAIALHGLHRVGISSRDSSVKSVAIIGAGPIGTLAAMCAKLYNVDTILLERRDSRLLIGKKIGVRHMINPEKENAIEKIKDITNGRMAEAVLEMSGSNRGVANSLEYASYCATVSLTGWPTVATKIFTPIITLKELKVVGSRTATHEIQEAITMIANGRIDVGAILSEIVPFYKVPEILQKISINQGRYLKVGVKFPDYI